MSKYGIVISYSSKGDALDYAYKLYYHLIVGARCKESVLFIDKVDYRSIQKDQKDTRNSKLLKIFKNCQAGIVLVDNCYAEHGGRYCESEFEELANSKRVWLVDLGGRYNFDRKQNIHGEYQYVNDTTHDAYTHTISDALIDNESLFKPKRYTGNNEEIITRRYSSSKLPITCNTSNSCLSNNILASSSYIISSKEQLNKIYKIKNHLLNTALSINKFLLAISNETQHGIYDDQVESSYSLLCDNLKLLPNLIYPYPGSLPNIFSHNYQAWGSAALYYYLRPHSNTYIASKISEGYYHASRSLLRNVSEFNKEKKNTTRMLRGFYSDIRHDINRIEAKVVSNNKNNDNTRYIKRKRNGDVVVKGYSDNITNDVIRNGN